MLADDDLMCASTQTHTESKGAMTQLRPIPP